MSFTVAGVSAALGLVGAATSAVGTIAGGQAAHNAAVYQSQVAHNNEIIANQNADYAGKAGQAQAAIQSMKGAAAQGKLKTAQAASGVDINRGSAVDIRAGQREAEKLDTETVLQKAGLAQYGYRAQATNFSAEAELDKVKGDSARTGAEIGAAGSLLSSASSLGLKWTGFAPSGGGQSGGEES